MDNIQLYSKICNLDSQIFDLPLDLLGRFRNIWFVMFLGFYFLAFFGLCLIYEANTSAVREMRHEIAAMQSGPPPKERLHAVPGVASRQ